MRLECVLYRMCSLYEIVLAAVSALAIGVDR